MRSLMAPKSSLKRSMRGATADTFRLAPSERAGAAERPRKPPRPTPRTAEKPSAGLADTSVDTAIALSMLTFMGLVIWESP